MAASFYLIILKTVVSILVVLGLVYISEKTPKIGGLLAGLPLGTGIVIFFYGIEQGPHFVMQSIPYGISGLVSSLSFIIGFYNGGKYFIKQPVLHVTSALLFSLIAFFSVSYFLSLFNITLIISLLIFIVGVVLATLYLNHIPINKKVTKPKPTLYTMSFRALFVTAIILLITGTAKLMGTQWAGVMASFPTAVCPLLIILAYSYKDELYPIVIKTFSYSISTLLVFYLLVLWLFPTMGVYSGTLIAYLVCFIYTYFLKKI